MNPDNGQSIPEHEIVNFIMNSTQARYQKLSWQGSFFEYLERVSAAPYKQTRTAYQLIRDMISHFGTQTYEDNGEEVKRYQLFDDPFRNGKNAIYGLERNIHKLVRFFDTCAEEQGKERIVILHGPVGTAKTSLIDMLASGLEAYTASPEGESYTFSWRFGKDFRSDGSGSMGFGGNAQGDYAGIHQPVALLPSQLNQHPLLLVPKEERRELLTKIFQSAGIADKHPIPFKLLEGELDYNSKQIYNFLIRKYEGNWRKVMEHILVQRIQFSEFAGVGIAKVSPESNQPTHAQPVTLDENYHFISNLIGSINLMRYSGKYVHANRGIIHYSDIFKKPAHAMQHLLGAIEEHRLDFGETTCNIDCVIIGTSNIHEYLALRQDPISKALRSRIRKFDIPYMRNYRNEEKIYKRELRQLKKKIKIAPHTTSLAARWAVMTRLTPTQLFKHQEFDSEAQAVLKKITPAMKMFLYAGEYPDELDSKERQKLNRAVRRRLFLENKYEGMNGVPTRALQNLFADLSEDETVDCFTPFQVFDLIDQVIQQGPENHDFLALEPEEQWFHPQAFLTLLRQGYDHTLRQEIESSVLDLDMDTFTKTVRNYLKHITAYNKKELVHNPIKDQNEPPSETLMGRVENAMKVPENDRKEFRFKMLNRASSAAEPGKILNIQELYHDIFTALVQNLFEEKRDSILWTDIEKILTRCKNEEAFQKFIAQEEDKKYHETKTLLKNLQQNFGYAYPCARVAVLYYIRSLLPETDKKP